MSLLMDALKKPEAAKTRHDLSLDDDALEADLAAVATSSPAQRPASAVRTTDDNPSMAAERVAVQNILSARQTPATFSPFWMVLGLAALAALGIVAYFWWQLRPLNVASTASMPPASISPTNIRSPEPQAAASLPPTLPTLPRTMTENLSGTPTATGNEVAEQTAGRSSAPVASSTNPPVSTIVPANQPQKRPVATVDGRRRTAPARPVALPQVGRTPGRAPLEQAYEALHADQTDVARKLYLQALGNDRHNTDALLGLATIAVREGKLAEAKHLYQRVLVSDPGDATAQAALTNLNGSQDHEDTAGAENRLKTALAGQPDSAALHFALGNLYARQQRWSEAQPAYFSAFSLVPDNPDYIFNLAVSLDHLRQRKLAAQYYQLAANLAQEMPRVSFDLEQAKRRAFELQP